MQECEPKDTWEMRARQFCRHKCQFEFLFIIFTSIYILYIYILFYYNIQIHSSREHVNLSTPEIINFPLLHTINEWFPKSLLFVMRPVDILTMKNLPIIAPQLVIIFRQTAQTDRAGCSRYRAGRSERKYLTVQTTNTEWDEIYSEP